MRDASELESWLRSWLELAEQETEAIEREDWAALAHCQERIRQLQAQCERATHANRDATQRLELRSLPPALRSVVTALLERERHNLTLLAERRARLQTELDRWSHVVLRLKRAQPTAGALRDSGWSRLS